MSGYVIDGLFLTQTTTGTQRYAYELTACLDKLIDKGVIQLLVPLWTKNIPGYDNIEVIRYGKRKGIVWQQTDLMRYIKKHKKQGIFLNNVCPLLYSHGIITIHDVCYKAMPQFYCSLRDKLSMLWHRLNYWRAAHSDMIILTVSEFSKSEIIRYYGVEPERITVIYNGWQHLERTEASDNVFEKYSFLKPGKYFFSMSSLAANKNFKWILYAAKNNPNCVFAIAGGGRLKGAAEAAGFAELPNIHFLGYISDEEAKALMANCKAFLFPTLYEGFGIPPLEAAACGCRSIIVSNTPCMREIYGDNAAYIDPYNYSGEIPGNICCVKDSLPGKYSWEKSAEKLAEILNI